MLGFLERRLGPFPAEGIERMVEVMVVTSLDLVAVLVKGLPKSD